MIKSESFLLFLLRYDHYATLCEVLPAGLPSLALCLAVLKEGEMIIFYDFCYVVNTFFRMIIHHTIISDYGIYRHIIKCSTLGSSFLSPMKALATMQGTTF
jgi:hypothetical protein